VTPIFALRAASLQRGQQTLLSNITLDLHPGEFVCILGPNGAGKSTLLRLLAGLIPPTSGTITLANQPLQDLPRRAIAKQLALVEPLLDLPFAHTVEQIVGMGRAPHMHHYFESQEDLAQTRQALATMDCEHLRHRDFRTLSSGEKQRVLVACALAQQPCVLLLDEPAAFLDLQHQVALFSTLKQLTASNYLVLAVTHDFNLAATWASRLLLLKNGAIAAQGPPSQLATPATLEPIFQTPLASIQGPGATPIIIPKP
jgi:iron complex transport system ATP-binding protein